MVFPASLSGTATADSGSDGPAGEAYCTCTRGPSTDQFLNRRGSPLEMTWLVSPLPSGKEPPDSSSPFSTCHTTWPVRLAASYVALNKILPCLARAIHGCSSRHNPIRYRGP